MFANPKSSNPRRTDRLNWLFLDLNSYFASVEQQENPKLRGQPVAVVPVETDHTCAIAASYEAKAFGVKTGTMIHEAKRKCPGLVCVLARHEKYVEYHHRVLAEIDRHIPVAQIASIDEVACQLPGELSQTERAVALSHEIKRGIARRVGSWIKCSIGLAPNRFLAKVASDMQKPDGLVLLRESELPGPLLKLELRDFPGIGQSMERRLWRARIDTVEQLWACSAAQLRGLWGSVEGERFWHRLRGVEIPDEPTQRRSVGHSHVLPPELRPAEFAQNVARRLTLKAASRLRRMEYYATKMDLSARVQDGPRWSFNASFPPVNDSPALLHTLNELWLHLLAETGPARIKKVSVTLHGLVAVSQLRQLELLPQANPTRQTARAEVRAARERLSQAMDQIARRFGRDAVTIGLMPRAADTRPGQKIAFNRVPELEDFDDLPRTQNGLTPPPADEENNS